MSASFSEEDLIRLTELHFPVIFAKKVKRKAMNVKNKRNHIFLFLKTGKAL